MTEKEFKTALANKIKVFLANELYSIESGKI